MIIKRTTFRNLKSYGNKLQQIDFNDTDRLILLKGTNGYGKSSILESISLSMFGIVNGKQNVKIPLECLPNRINKSLYTSTEFYNNNNDYIKISRYISPNKFEIIVNNENYTDKYKKLSPDDRTALIGANYNTFKSFISLDLNTFNDFISLKEDTKRNLINKLFNLEEIDNYYYTTVELINQNKKIIEQLTIEISNIDIELNDLKKLIESNKNVISVGNKEDIKVAIIQKNDIFKLKKAELTDIRNKISDFSVKIQENKNSSDGFDQDNYKRRLDLNDVNSKLKIHENGVCPYCASKLDSDNHINTLTELKEKKEKLLSTIDINETKVNNYKESIKSLSTQRSVLTDSIDIITDECTKLQSEIISLKDKYTNHVDADTTIIGKLKEKGATIISTKKEKLEKITKLKNENISLESLKIILSESGIRNNITSSLIVPINNSLSDFLKFLKFPYEFELDDKFNGILTEKGNIINHETLSNGESQILNLCIALSYIDMILKTNDINILFMDEVFSSIAFNNITEIVRLLKQFSIDNSISLILVHHGLEQLDSKLFDKIITVEKNTFSDIKIN